MFKPTPARHQILSTHDVKEEMIQIDYLSRHVAYEADTRVEGDIFVPFYHHGQGLRYRTRKIRTNTNALVGEVFEPEDPNTDNTIVINWQGTRNRAQMIADLFEGCPANISYQENERVIMRQLLDIIHNAHQRSAAPLKIYLTGHSLGATLAQSTFNSLQKALVSRQLSTTAVASLNLGVLNSPGVAADIEASSNELAQTVDRLGVRQRAVFGYVAGDLIQTSGHGAVLSDVDADTAHVHVVKMDIGFEGYYLKGMFYGALLGSAFVFLGIASFVSVLFMMMVVGGLSAACRGTLATHSTLDLQSFDSLMTFHFLNNQIAQDRIKVREHLQQKSKMLGVILLGLYGIKCVLGYGLHLINKTVRLTFKGIRNLLTFTVGNFIYNFLFAPDTLSSPRGPGRGMAASGNADSNAARPSRRSNSSRTSRRPAGGCSASQNGNAATVIFSRGSSSRQSSSNSTLPRPSARPMPNR